ncbi:MAG: hypothetical protein M1816_004515 [Peltula sp. TS41687]|nr:MAG: hypothetical protein M1816_004515 [Peltula sp. TS41687]
MVPSIRIAPTAAKRAVNLLRALQFTHPPDCPCHSNSTSNLNGLSGTKRSFATPTTYPPSSEEKEYAFEMAASSIRFGEGCTKEVGMDLKNLGAKKVMVVTDQNISRLDIMSRVVEALSKEAVDYVLYDRTTVEPKDSSLAHSLLLPPLFGGGSVIDTAKLMNLYTCYPRAPFLDFVNAPLGAGRPITKRLRPLIAIPTTAGTGSETTGVAIFDLASKKTKTGIAHRALKPTLGLVDPLNTRSMPAAVHASSGLDVLCHALESWTALPYTQRTPRPTNPIDRPAYQGSNPISDIFSLRALQDTIRYLPRAATQDDPHAQSKMLLSATLAGIGFGNAGVHLCHGMSYPVSGLNPAAYSHPGYDVPAPLIPHGVSVAVTAPAVFRFTGPSDPERHLRAAEAFGVDITGVKRESAGEVLSEALKEFLVKLGGQPRGLKELGFTGEHVPALVEGTLPQKRVLMLAPNLAGEVQDQTEQLARLFEDAMSY